MAFGNGKKYGQPMDTRKVVTGALGLETVMVEPIGIDGFVIPAPDPRVACCTRSISGLKIRGGHNGLRPWDNWSQPRLEPTMGRHQLMSEAFEEHKFLAEVESDPIVVPQPWCSEIELADFHWEIEQQLAEDAWWASFEQRLIDETEAPEFDHDIVEVMGVEAVEEVVPYKRTGWNGADLGDDFDDPEWENPLGSLLN